MAGSRNERKRLSTAVPACSGLRVIAQVTPDTDIPQPGIVGGRLGKAFRPLLDQWRGGGLLLPFRHDRTEIAERERFELQTVT